MKRVIVETKSVDVIGSENIANSTSIFAKLGGKLCGMVVYEESKGWVLKIGGRFGCSGYYETREECMLAAMEFDYEFYVED